MSAIDDIAGPKKARVEIIPLIDVVFFLLATFVLFVLTLHRVRVVEATFPQVQDDVRDRPVDSSTAFVQASSDGALVWRVGRDAAADTLTLAELPLRLESYKREVVAPRVLVRSDHSARLASLVVILDAVRKAEIRDVAVETVASASGR